MKKEHAHNPKRQFRREMEAKGLVAKTGRQWRKFRKMMQRLAKEKIPNAVTRAAIDEARELSAETLKNIETGVAQLKAGEYTTLTYKELEGMAQAEENLGQELSSEELDS